MSKNIYKETIESISVSDEALEKAIISARSYRAEKNTTKPKQKRVYMFRATSVIAASLVVIILFGVVFFPTGNSENSGNGFVLRTNAAEITPESYVEIGELEGVTGGGHFKTHKHLGDDGKIVVVDNDVEVVSLTREFNLAVNCSGENIESITYTANNGYLICDPFYEGVVSFTELTDEEREVYNASQTTETESCKFASSCTFDYSNQPESRLDFEIPKDGVDGSFPLRAAFIICGEENEYVTTTDENGIINEEGIYYQMFNDHADEFSIDVTANFANGTSSTKTLQLKCEYDGNNEYLTAKIK